MKTKDGKSVNIGDYLYESHWQFPDGIARVKVIGFKDIGKILVEWQGGHQSTQHINSFYSEKSKVVLLHIKNLKENIKAERKSLKNSIKQLADAEQYLSKLRLLS